MLGLNFYVKRLSNTSSLILLRYCFFHSGIRRCQQIRGARETNEKFRIAEQRQQEGLRYKNRTAAYYTSSVILVFLALGFGSVPLYRALCQRTGWGGTPMTDSNRVTPDKVVPVETDKRIRIQFTCQSSGVLPWKFVPEQREVYVVPGETALAFYRAKNLAKEDITGMATYSVIPEVVAPYFNKIQCFCFEEQRLSAGEEIDMPVFFFIDPDFAKDPQLRNVDDVVLNYSFFKSSDANNYKLTSTMT